MGTVIVHSGDLGGSIHSLSGGSSAVSDDDYNNDDEGSGTMVIRDEVMLERLHSGDYDATAAPGANGDDAAASVIVHSSRSEVQPSSSANSPRPWLNKYRSPETWVRICARAVLSCDARNSPHTHTHTTRHDTHGRNEILSLWRRASSRRT
jgi:hypothetical protein